VRRARQPSAPTTATIPCSTPSCISSAPAWLP